MAILKSNFSIYTINGNAICREKTKKALKRSEYGKSWFTDIGKAKRFLKDLYNAKDKKIRQINTNRWELRV